MKELANRLAMQHLVNAYTQETANAILLEEYQQNSKQHSFSQGLNLLVVRLEHLQAKIYFPLSYVSLVGRHRLAKMPIVLIKGQEQNFSPVAIVTLMLEELLALAPDLDSSSLVERWIQSRDALFMFLNHRRDNFDELVQFDLNFIASEQALVLGHSMHPAPKSRTGFIHEDWQHFSPESLGRTQLHYFLVHQDYVVEGSAFDQPISQELAQCVRWHLDEQLNNLMHTYSDYKLIPFHPWQARYLSSKTWYAELKQKNKLIDLGLQAWAFSPTTSVRTLASFEAPWQFKPSLSVMITNSIRCNLFKECHRGELSHRLWHSNLGKKILSSYPTLKAINDPAWIALCIDNEVINESICIFRDQPFTPSQQVTCIASLCQDHPQKDKNRFNAIFDYLVSQKKGADYSEIALSWFNQFLQIGLEPLMGIYHRYGMAFESHQQNVLLELEQGWPKYLWLRDNQGFYYIEELAGEILEEFPELKDKAFAVGHQDFVDERFSYYFFGNTLFGIINAIGATGYISERELMQSLQSKLKTLHSIYPNSSLIHDLLYQPTLPYKGNLLTRLHELDELIAPVEHQSIYIRLANPLFIEQKEISYA